MNDNIINDIDGTARHGTARHGTARHGTARHGTGVSILICTYNRVDVLTKCLESISHLVANKQQYEVVVVNNNCSDNTSEVCQSFADANPDIQFREVIEPKQGLTFARNKAIAEAKFELLSFIDDDVTVVPNFVDAIVVAFVNNPNYNAGGGRVYSVFEGNVEPEYLSNYLNPFGLLDYGDTIKEFPSKNKAKYPFGCNMIFRKEIFEKYGGFPNIALNRADDRDIFHRLKENNEKVIYIADALVYHYMPKERFSYDGLMGLGYATGKSQAVWLKSKKRKQQLAMAAERIFKFGASIGIGAFFYVTFRPLKARYLLGYMYNMTKGYFRHCTWKSTS